MSWTMCRWPVRPDAQLRARKKRRSQAARSGRGPALTFVGPATGPGIIRQSSVLDVEAALFELLLGALASVFLDDAAVEEMDGAVGVPCIARVVRDHADGGALAVQFAQELHHRLAVLRVEVPRG